VCVCVRVCVHACVVWVWVHGVGVWLCECSLTNPAYNAPPYCNLRPVWIHHIFRHYLINGTIFGEKVTEHKMCILIFSTTFIWNISHCKMSSARYCHECENVFMKSIPYSFRILINLQFSRQIFEKKRSITICKKGTWQTSFPFPQYEEEVLNVW
jgi:hypothetical protein